MKGPHGGQFRFAAGTPCINKKKAAPLGGLLWVLGFRLRSAGGANRASVGIATGPSAGDTNHVAVVDVNGASLHRAPFIDRVRARNAVSTVVGVVARCALGGDGRRRDVFGQVGGRGRVDVADVGVAGAVDGGAAGAQQVRDEHRREDADDRDNDQQLDEGETLGVLTHVRPPQLGPPDRYE
jgi:hypothetical protein